MLRKSALLTVLVTVLAVGAFATPASADQATTMHSSCSASGHVLTVDTHYIDRYNYGNSYLRTFDYVNFRLTGSGTHNNFNMRLAQGNNVFIDYYSPDNVQPNITNTLVIYPDTGGFTTNANSYTTFTFEGIFDESFAPDPRCTATLVVPPMTSPLIANNPGTPTNTVNTPVNVQLYAFGGYTPYHWSSTALPAGLSLNGSTGVISGTPTVVGTTNVTVTVTDAYTYTASTNFNWVINPAPLTLSISGPGTITGKGTYTYSAVYSGFYANPGFAWSERFCYDQASTNCSSWVALTGLGANLTRTLNKDCSGTGENSYQLALTMTNADGRSASTNFTSYLCEAA